MRPLLDADPLFSGVFAWFFRLRGNEEFAHGFRIDAAVMVQVIQVDVRTRDLAREFQVHVPERRIGVLVDDFQESLREAVGQVDAEIVVLYNGAARFVRRRCGQVDDSRNSLADFAHHQCAHDGGCRS